MKNFLTIMLCLALVAMAGNVFGQLKPGKKPLQTNSVSQIKSPANVQTINTNNKEACWEIIGPNGYREYYWDTEAGVQQWINEKKSKDNAVYEYALCDHMTIEACDASNEKINPKKCWKITATKNGQTIEQYLWVTEIVARRKALAMKKEGYQNANYVQTPANDEKSCLQSANNSNGPNCWKITIGEDVSYLWGYEQDAQATVNAARNSGKTASYELTPNRTKDSCR